jgi:hypothetical protein
VLLTDSFLSTGQVPSIDRGREAANWRTGSSHERVNVGRIGAREKGWFWASANDEALGVPIVMKKEVRYKEGMAIETQSRTGAWINKIAQLIQDTSSNIACNTEGSERVSEQLRSLRQ